MTADKFDRYMKAKDVAIKLSMSMGSDVTLTRDEILLLMEFVPDLENFMLTSIS